MLTDAPVTTILPVVDVERAKDFYGNRLGLALEGVQPDGQIVYAGGGGARIALSPRQTGTRADHTALSFDVKDIAATIQALEQRGVAFADYDLPGLKTVDHVCVLGAVKAAWFNDPDGNILCIHEVIG